MPNTFAYLALFSWPLIAIVIFRVQQDHEKAIIWSLLWSFLFLPVATVVDLPGVPPLDKRSIPALMLLVLVVLAPKLKFRIWPDSWVGKMLLIALVGGQFATVLSNGDPIWVGGRVLQGTSLYDALSSSVQLMVFLVPLLVGRALMATTSAQRSFLEALVAAGLIYSVLMLIEVRLSPQLHNWIYGFFPHSFAQTVRGGGFRPNVLLDHGLYVGFFAMSIFLAATTLWRQQRVTQTRPREERGGGNRTSYSMITLYLGGVLVLVKSLGALLYGLVLVPLAALAKPKTQLTVALILTILAITYPLTRSAYLFPTDSLLSVAQSIDPGRAQSLETRFTNEDQLLDRASERPLVGWGGWGRNRIYDENTGKNISVTDGYWIIVIGTNGWIGFLATFGLLALPIFLIHRQYRRRPGELQPITAGLCLLLAINMVELLPNSTLFPWTWLMAGMLWGHAEQLAKQPLEPSSPVEEVHEKGPRKPRTIL